MSGGARRRAPAIALGAALTAAQLVPAAASADPYPAAELRALDKVTTRSTTITVGVGETVRFRTLEITLKVCDKRPPEERPEAAAFLDILEVREGKPVASVFRGWMFASSPGLSPMQHPVYDIWVLDCVGSGGGGADSSADKAADKAAGSGSP